MTNRSGGGNYPPENDSTYRYDTYNFPAKPNTNILLATSEGGSSGEVLSKGSQHGLVEQSLSGGPLKDELKDAKQGSDTESREAFRHEQIRDSSKPISIMVQFSLI